MAFLRHVGKVGDRKVAVIFREVPGEPHMCLVVYTEILNQHIHDPLMKCIESDIGQNSSSLSDALNRSYTNDGRIILQVLHAEHQLKKVQTSQIVMTPQPNVNIRLDELNKLLNEMDQGDAAVKRLSEMDKSLGLQDPTDVARRMRELRNPQPVQASGDVLGDTTIADNLRQQAERMQNEAKGLMAESDRLLKEAAALDPVLVTVVTETKTRKPKVKKVNVT
jgi:hypothetical protein